jgi:biopolymer transport protein ExbD
MRYSKATHSAEQDFELNIASIIDCFTVLITYMLISASFISLGVLDVTDLTPRASGDVTPDPEVSLVVEVMSNHNVSLKLSAGASHSTANAVSIPAKDGEVDRDAMSVQLDQIKQKYPSLEAAVLKSASQVEYDQIVKVIDSSKKFVPNITLGERIE